MRAAYDRSGVTAGIVHLGLGGFARSHLAWYADRLLAGGGHPGWGICGVGLRDTDAPVIDALDRQDGLYALVLKHPSGELEARVIGSVVERLHAPASPSAVIARMAAPATSIVSLTITEGGYGPGDEHGVFAMLAAAIRRRRAGGLPALTVMSCDNLEGNGEAARAALARAAPDLDEWIGEHVSFPSSMVDRITPATTDADRHLVRRQWGFADDVPVVAEPFAQWVLEDSFGSGRPAFERVGVQLVQEVRPYELMKLRLLNAGHQALAYPALLAGYVLVHEALADPAIRATLRAFWAEALPTLPEVPGIDLAAYTDSLLERFGNPHVADSLARLATCATDRLQEFVLPIVRDNLDAGRPVDACARVLADWSRWSRLSSRE